MPGVGSFVLTITPYGTVYIRADGRVDPPTAPISTEDNFTYEMTASIFSSSLEIERDNVVFDGMGYSLQGGGSGDGVNLSGRSNVTIENANIQQFTTGIMLNSSYGDTVVGNNIMNNTCGVWLDASSDCTVSGNNLQNNSYAIRLDASSGDAMFRNDATSNEAGIYLDSSSNSNISENCIEANSWIGIYLENSLDNLIFDNNLTANWDGIFLEFSSNDTVDGNNVNASSYMGIELGYSSNNKVAGNNVTANSNYGITLYYSSDNEVLENYLSANGHYGLWIFGSSSNTVFRNVVTATAGFGVWLICSSNTTLVDNAMTDNGYNFMVERLTEWDLNSVTYADFVNNVDTSNTVDGRPIYYWIDKQDLTVPEDAGYVILVNCTRIKVQDLNLTRNGQGILLAYTTDSTVTRNIVSDDYDGIVLESSTNNAISENSITTNYYFGLWLSSSMNNSVVGNNAINNLVDIALLSSSSNNIYHNNFIKRITATTSGLCAYTTSDSINTWDAGYASDGNYWSDYSGVDEKSGPYQNLTGGDGIGDTPHAIDSRNVDYYPLMQPWTGLLQDVAVTNVTANCTWVYQGFSVKINVTIQNKGDYAGNVSIALYYNITANELAGVQRVALSSGGNQTLTFVWDTEDVPYCHNYTLTAVVMMTDNTLNGGPITVRILGDINGDGVVDGSDIALAAKAFGSYGPGYLYPGSPPSSRWNPDCDLNGDGVVDGQDMVLVARNFGK
jgi:parallel beta-helix repeat protein